MKTSYMIKSEHIITHEIGEKIIEDYEKSLEENKVLVMDKDIELYKNENGIYVKVF